mgnify:CR=1 FL=1|jgi:hypothetical protein
MKYNRIEHIVRNTIQEVYSEKQRKWACVQANLPANKRQKSLSKKEAEEMCRDTKISKKPMKEAEETITPASAAQARQYSQTTQFRKDTGEVVESSMMLDILDGKIDANTLTLETILAKVNNLEENLGRR